MSSTKDTFGLLNLLNLGDSWWRLLVGDYRLTCLRWVQFLGGCRQVLCRFWSASGDLWWRHEVYFWLGFSLVGILVLVLGFSLIIGAVSVDFTGAIFCVLQ
jgi:hypothetical protein